MLILYKDKRQVARAQTLCNSVLSADYNLTSAIRFIKYCVNKSLSVNYGVLNDSFRYYL